LARYLPTHSIRHFDSIAIRLASPEKIKDWAKNPNPNSFTTGEVKKPETINYRTFRPERDGLFCEAIFGPTKDWECSCGKYKRIKYKGVVCERCGVEVTLSKVRRERMGYVQLATPVSHIWFFKSVPSHLGLLLDLSLKELERVLYYEAYLVLDPGDSPLEFKDRLTEEQYQALLERGYHFRAETGASAVKEILDSIDLSQESALMEQELSITNSKQKAKKIRKRLGLVRGLQKTENHPSWMVLDVIPVMPPELRPLVALDGGRFATSDLNDLYRRVINRNNRLKRLVELKAPEVIIRNEKRMLQEAVDALIENGKHGRVVKGPGNRPLKSLSDMLKGKPGRFRQNLLGKRVDYSGRSVIVVGPELKLHQCGLPKKMALELFKPFIIRKLQERNYATTIKSAKRMTERLDEEVWEVLEEVIQEHPVLLNRAPTLHRLGIQAFQPHLVEGEAIRIHPLVCSAFNADFDGDQMAVHVPLSPEAQVEAQFLMASHRNILKPAHGNPIAVPDLDMVLGCNYLTKRVSAETVRGFGVGGHTLTAGEEGGRERVLRFASPAEVVYAYDAGHVKVHDLVDVRVSHEGGSAIVRTTPGRVLFNEALPPDLMPARTPRHSYPEEYGSSGLEIDDEDLITIGDEDVQQDRMRTLEDTDVTKPEMLFDCVDISTKSAPRAVRLPFVNRELKTRGLEALVAECFRVLGNRRSVELLNDLQNIGFRYATTSGLSLAITDFAYPSERGNLKAAAEKEVEGIRAEYQAGRISDGEQYNRIVAVWARLTEDVQKSLFDTLGRGTADQRQAALPAGGTPDNGGALPAVADGVDPDSEEHYAAGFNPVHIMADSGARARYDQMRQIAGMRGLMAKPDGSIIERPIFTSLREGLSVLEYFISTHGARKGLADTAIKTASSGYLTRKLVDVSQDVIVTTDDCGTLDGVTKTEMEADEEGSRLSTLLVGRVTTQSIVNPATNEELVPPNTVIDVEMADRLNGVELLEVTVRSPLTCETIWGVCQMCYGMDLTNHRLVDIGEAIGIIAAQSIGEPGTQLTMRTFHTGGTASTAAESSLIHARAREGKVVYHNLEPTTRDNGDVMALRNGAMSIEGPDGRERERRRVPAGSTILVTEGQSVVRDDELFTGAADHVPILTKVKGVLRFEDVIPGVTLEELVDDVTGQRERVITEYRENMPRAEILTAADGEVIEAYMLPAGARLSVNAGAEVLPGDTLARMPRQAAKTSDIVTGLPRVTELFEARKPKDHATISEITGEISFQGMSRGMQVVRVTPQDAPDNYREYKIPLGKFIVVQEGDSLEVGDPLTDGSLNPHDILDVKGKDEVQRYIVKEIKAVYRRQGERINDKHCEVIIRQMMKKVRVTDAGDTDFLEGDEIPLTSFRRENTRVATHPTVHVAEVALESADEYVGGEVGETIEIDGEVAIEEGGVLTGELLDKLRTAGLETLHMVFESDSSPAEAAPLLQGITKAALSTESFISAASFQQTTNVLTKAAAMGKRDTLRGLKENVIMGRLIPAGTGLSQHHRVTVAPRPPLPVGEEALPPGDDPALEASADD
jgi:DNA-directed RNA polymerase subunit beta'